MEQQSVSENSKLLEPLLRKFEKDEGLVIENVEKEPGSKVGDNYLSIIMRINVTGKRGNGDPYSATLITKQYPRHRSIVDVIRNADFFANEAHSYMKILPKLGPIGPACLYADSNEIIMEDLKAGGYVVADRRNLLDLNHCEAAIKTLAILHARSLMLKLKNPEEFYDLLRPLKEAVFPEDDGPTLGRSIDLSVNRVIKNLSDIENRSEELENAFQFVKRYENRSFVTLRELFFKKKEKYDLLIHGDTWNNNITFRYDDNDRRIVDVKLLDFQVMRHVSPAIDFHYFVYSSANSNVITEKYNYLVGFYHKSLIDELKKLRADENVIRDLSVDWFKKELCKTAIYGLFTGFWLVNALLAEENETIDMDTLTPEVFTDQSDFFVPTSEIKLERIKMILLHFYRTYR